MNRRPLLAGNWKMHFNVAQATELAREIASISKDFADRDIMLAPLSQPSWLYKRLF